MKVSRCSAISFVSACYIHVSQSKKKKTLIPWSLLLKGPDCHIFVIWWQYAMYSGCFEAILWWQLWICVDSWVYYAQLFFQFFFFIKRHISSHYIISEITLMCWGKNTPGILCAVTLIHTMHFFLHLLPFGPRQRYYWYFCKTTHLYSRTSSARALLAFMAVSLPAANRGQWGDRLGISDHR